MKDSEGNILEDADVYVWATDSFMSRWGKAKGKINILVFSCHNDEDVSNVIDTISSRNEMNYKDFGRKLPDFNLDKIYLQFKTEKDYPYWYRE